MKRFFASILTAGVMLPVAWYYVAPKGAEYCQQGGYAVVRENSLHAGQFDTLEYSAPSVFCEMVEEFPMPA